METSSATRLRDAGEVLRDNADLTKGGSSVDRHHLRLPDRCHWQESGSRRVEPHIAALPPPFVEQAPSLGRALRTHPTESKALRPASRLGLGQVPADKRHSPAHVHSAPVHVGDHRPVATGRRRRPRHDQVHHRRDDPLAGQFTHPSQGSPLLRGSGDGRSADRPEELKSRWVDNVGDIWLCRGHSDHHPTVRRQPLLLVLTLSA